MANDLNYQVRISLTDASAQRFKENPGSDEFVTLLSVLAKYDASLKCQFDAFSEYVQTADREGVDKYFLYQWTKDTIEDPTKKSKYLKSFTVYVLDNQVYPGDIADALEKDLNSLLGGEFILAISKYDTNPVNNPQMPEKYRTNV